jgi:Secretory lipase
VRLACDALPKIVRRSVLLAATAAALTGHAAEAAAAPPAPASDPFYSYPAPLKDVPPGTVLSSRQVQISVAGTPRAYPATQLLYRTTDQLGRPSATVATIIRPAGAAVTPVKLLSYQTFYDGVASTCRPSYTLQAGDPSNTTANADEALMLDYVQQGFTVVTSDYEGPTDDYGAGHESGYGTLDAIRAAEHELRLQPNSTPVGMVGYSGGSIASEWASELQPTYAPELDIIGVAEGGIPADYVHVLDYIDGSSAWAGAIPAVSLGLMRAWGLNVAKYASAEGMQIYKQVAQGCLNPTAYPGLKLEDLLKPQYKNWRTVPIFVKIFNASIMGLAGTPKEPLLMGVGNADGTGDGVMVAKDVQELAYVYCTRHVPVAFHVYSNSDHVQAAPQFEAQAVQFLQALYSGQSVTNECSSISPGNPLTPLPDATQPRKTSPRLELRSVTISPRQRGVRIALSTTQGTLGNVTVKLTHGRKLVAQATLPRLGVHARGLVLRSGGHMPPPGRYALTILVGRTAVLHRAVTIEPKARRPRLNR